MSRRQVLTKRRLTILTIGYWVVHATNHAPSSHEMLSIGVKESQASNAEISIDRSRGRSLAAVMTDSSCAYRVPEVCVPTA